jgi:hypothetical protein
METTEYGGRNQTETQDFEGMKNLVKTLKKGIDRGWVK